MNSANSSYYRPRKSEIPENAKHLTREEVLRYQWESIDNEKNRLKVWPFTIGTSLIAASSAVTGILFVNNFRRRFKLRGYSLLLTFLPGVIIPTGFSLLSNRLGVVDDILTGQFNHCSTCAHTRAMFIQTLAGLIYPLMMTPITTITAAKRHNTIAVPPMYPLKQLRINLPKLMRPLMPTFVMCSVVQVALTVYITTRQQESFVKLMRESDLVHTS